MLKVARDPKYGIAMGRSMTERSLMPAIAFLAAADAPDRITQAVSRADTAVAARERVRALLGIDGWLAEWILNEPLCDFSRERIAEMRDRRTYLLERTEQLYGSEAAEPFRHE